MVSAMPGTPGRPRRVATSPSCTSRPCAREASSGWTNTVRSKVAAYSSARRMTSVAVTGESAFDTPTQPASASAPISARSSPRNPWVSAPSTSTRAAPASAARWCISSTTAGVSTTGLVSGGTHTVVMPPATAAVASLAMVALCSSPGSRSRARRSTSPGQTTHPVTSRSRSAANPSGARSSATMRPSATNRSPTASRPLAGSMMRPPRSAIRLKRHPRCRCARRAPSTSLPCGRRCRR